MAHPSYEDANRVSLRIHKNRKVMAKKVIYDPANGHSNVLYRVDKVKPRESLIIIK